MINYLKKKLLVAIFRLSLAKLRIFFQHTISTKLRYMTINKSFLDKVNWMFPNSSDEKPLF